MTSEQLGMQWRGVNERSCPHTHTTGSDRRLAIIRTVLLVPLAILEPLYYGRSAAAMIGQQRQQQPVSEI